MAVSDANRDHGWDGSSRPRACRTAHGADGQERITRDLLWFLKLITLVCSVSASRSRPVHCPTLPSYPQSADPTLYRQVTGRFAHLLASPCPRRFPGLSGGACTSGFSRAPG